MAEPLANEVGLLRTMVRNLERTPMPVDPRAVAFWRAQGGCRGDDWKTTIRPAGHNAFNGLSDCLIAHSAAMERGTNFANFQTRAFQPVKGLCRSGPRDYWAPGRAASPRSFQRMVQRPCFAAQGLCPMRAHSLGGAAV